MTEREYNAIINRQRRLPEQIWAARKKLAMLIAEAERHGMLDDILSIEFNGDLLAIELVQNMQNRGNFNV
jgi:hypothetical protein